MVRLQLLGETDVDDLAQVYADAYAAYDIGEPWTKEAAEKLLRYWLKRQPDLCFMAEIDGIHAGGFVAAIEPGWEGNHLVDGDLFVAPQFQHQGVGKQLFQTMLTESVRKYKVVTFDIYTFKRKDFPLGWYKKIGFKENEEWMLLSGNIAEIRKKLDAHSEV